MTTKATIDGYFGSLKQKKGWESFFADFETPASKMQASVASTI